MLAPWLVVALQLASAPNCITIGNKIACGYHCVSNLTQMACAATAEGMCEWSPSRVACWDPPADVRWLMQTRDDLPAPSCVHAGAQAACGYHCVRSANAVACADSPMGACITRFGRLLCWDPPVEVRWQMEQSGELVAATCATSINHEACGYQCNAIDDAVACASSPAGICRAGLSTVACFDPPTPAFVPVALGR